MRAIKYRELKRMYEVNGAEKTVQHLQEALRDGRPEARGFQHPRAGRGDAEPGAGAADGSAAGRRLPVGGRRRRRRDRVLEHHRPGDPGEDPGGLQPGGVRAFQAGRDHSHAARRRADSRHRAGQRRGGRGAARHALSQPGLRRGLHRHAADHQARLHRAGHQGGRSSSTART